MRCSVFFYFGLQAQNRPKKWQRDLSPYIPPYRKMRFVLNPSPKAIYVYSRWIISEEINMKQIQMIQCELCDSEATRFLDNINEIGEVCDSCYCEVGI